MLPGVVMLLERREITPIRATGIESPSCHFPSLTVRPLLRAGAYSRKREHASVSPAEVINIFLRKEN